MDLTCPKCQSNNTQKITAVINSGTTHIEGSSSSGQIGDATQDFQGTHTSELAKKFPKPEKKSESALKGTVITSLVGGWIPAVMIVNLFMSKSSGNTQNVVFFLLFAATVFVIHSASKKSAAEHVAYNRNQYPKELHSWENGYYCHRCENVFTPK